MEPDLQLLPWQVAKRSTLGQAPRSEEVIRYMPSVPESPMVSMSSNLFTESKDMSKKSHMEQAAALAKFEPGLYEAVDTQSAVTPNA